MRAVVGAALLASALGAASQAQAQSYQQVVQNELAGLASRAREQGFRTQVGQTITGTLNNGTQTGLTITLVGGGSYVVFAACDQDCTDIDLRLFAPDGQMIGEDIETDDRPVIIFTAPTSGTYRLQVMMATCSQNPCYWGAQVLAR
ncbi:MAG TPA: hypothetical protein VNL98_08500 [Gemmatimonadales bacterium]|nr:hypothetical protein [Gemmatimonadales bacterium]